LTPDPLRNARSLLLRTTMDQGSSLVKHIRKATVYSAIDILPIYLTPDPAGIPLNLWAQDLGSSLDA